MAAKMDSTTSVPQQQLSTFPIIIPPHMTQALPSGDPSHYFHWALNHFRDKSLTLGTQLAVCVHQLQMTTKYQQILEKKNHELTQQLKECQAQLEQRDQTLQECQAQLEQSDLVQRIWAPVFPPSIGSKKKRAYMEDASTGELMLIPVDQHQAAEDFLDHPLTVKRVAFENGFKCSKQDLYKLSGHVYSAFLAKNGKPPHLKILRDLEGHHHSAGCFVERDRGLILAVLEKFGEPVLPATQVD